jgi:hypothetical protein
VSSVQTKVYFTTVKFLKKYEFGGLFISYLVIILEEELSVGGYLFKENICVKLYSSIES